MHRLFKGKTHRDYFEKLAPRWDTSRDQERRQQLYRILGRFALTWQSAPTILDVGTGRGMLLPLLRSLAPQAQIAAIDLAEAMLSNARFQQSDSRLIQADGQRLPFRPGLFKVVVCHAVFPHFADPEEALADIRRVLLPGGTLFIVHDIGRDQVNAIHQQAQDPVKGDRLLPAADMGRLLYRAGFAVIRLEDAPDHYLAVGQTPQHHG